MSLILDPTLARDAHEHRPVVDAEAAPSADARCGSPEYVTSSVAAAGSILTAGPFYGSCGVAVGVARTATNEALHVSASEPAAAQIRASKAKPQVARAQDGPSAVGHWLGATPERVSIGNNSFDLSLCYLGSVEQDRRNPAIIDPGLEIGPAAGPATCVPNQLTPYQSLSPAQRRWYLEWMSDGRRSIVPRGFLLLFLAGVEHAVIRDGILADIGEVRSELLRLVKLHNDEVFASHAQKLIVACEVLDPDFVPTPIYASANANHRDEMPFDVRHFLGWMLKTAGRLEADAGLVFYLQQPGTRLDPIAAQYFRELHEQWCYQFSEAAADTFVRWSELPRLSLPYEAITGDFTRTLQTDLPDVGQMPVPQALQELFSSISQSLAHLRHEPVGRMIANMPVLGKVRRTQQEEFFPKAGAAAKLEAMLADNTAQPVGVSDLVEALLDAPHPKPGKLLPKRTTDQLTRMLDERGLGFEPDRRFGLPDSLRPGERVVLFRTEKFPFEQPTDAYHLVQAAVVVLALAQAWFPSLRPLNLDNIEQQLPYRHRFSDRELRRLEATALSIAHLGKPRIFLGRWIKNLARDRRLDRDLVGGFGLAFTGQRRNSFLARHARAVSLACEGLISVDDLLAAASDSAIPPESLHIGLDQRVQRLKADPEGAGPLSNATVALEAPALSGDPLPSQPVSLAGLEGRHAELLVALSDRARTREEFKELASARRLTPVGAIDRINEWALLEFGACAITEDDSLAITLEAADYLAQRGAPA